MDINAHPQSVRSAPDTPFPQLCHVSTQGPGRTVTASCLHKLGHSQGSFTTDAAESSPNCHGGWGTVLRVSPLSVTCSIHGNYF